MNGAFGRLNGFVSNKEQNPNAVLRLNNSAKIPVHLKNFSLEEKIIDPQFKLMLSTFLSLEK